MRIRKEKSFMRLSCYLKLQIWLRGKILFFIPLKAQSPLIKMRVKCNFITKLKWTQLSMRIGNYDKKINSCNCMKYR